MKKTLTSILLFFALMPVKADEGMWTIYNLPQAVLQQMKGMGLKLNFDQLYSNPNALKNCVVNFGGFCSGVVVSSQGLVFTNHHCGFEAIRSHSTVEHDYMRDGFYAKNFNEELPNERLFVSFMIDQKDITDKILAAHIDTMSVDHAAKTIAQIESKLNAEAKAKDSTLHVQVDAFYEGNKYFATTYRDYPDVRLVFTIPKSMGKFGGETDNWMWPRQTCDFSVFRIYVDPKTGKPAPYSPKNVPLRTKDYAKVSLRGYKEGSYAMTIGYPGSTSRYLSSFGIKERRYAMNAPRAEIRGIKQEIMTRHMRANEAVRIKYDTRFAQSANYWKNSIGMNKCIDSIGIISQKQQYEAKIKAWQEKSGYLKDSLDLNLLSQLYAQREQNVKNRLLLREAFINTSELFTKALKIHNLIEKYKDKPQTDTLTYKFEDESNAWDESLDKEVMAALMLYYCQHVSKDAIPQALAHANKEGKLAAFTAYVDSLYANSVIMQSGVQIKYLSAPIKADPAVVLAEQIMQVYKAQTGKISDISRQIEKQEKYLCAAKLRMEEDLPHYSDANFTMRLSYGKVGGFNLGGKPSGYYTTAQSIVEKFNKGAKMVDYQVEPIMKKLLSAKSFRPYADPKTKKLQLCFLTNNDITGGNSGSPMFDGDGHLIGLAFDGNWDSLASDINFDRQLARCIGVDIRFVLFMMDKWGHADRLIKEMDLCK